jgi:hypothetical protein
MALLMVFVSSALVVRAAEEPPVPIPFTPTDSAPEYAVYFADNMAFTPQWRIGNLVRIEMMVLKVPSGLVEMVNADGLTTMALSTPVAVNTDITTGVAYDQADLIGDPNLILNTWMVSVPYIAVTIEVDGAESDYTNTFVADFTNDVDESELGREINKAGHLIYGMQWDTTGVPAGIPKVTVSVPEYNVLYAVRSLVLAEDADPVAYELLPTGDPAVAVIGTGGLEAGNAYLYLGVLMKKGGSSGGGGHRGKFSSVLTRRTLVESCARF